MIEDHETLIADLGIDDETGESESNTDCQTIIDELAGLSPIEYDKQRIEQAKTLDIRPGTLDKEVAKARIEKQAANELEVVETLESWPDAVTGDDLVSDITKTLADHVLLQPGQATALALWALGTYCMDHWRLFPKVLITSPEKRCGKSTLMETIEGLVYRPLLASNISPSAIYRCIEAWAPTMLLDEADTFTKDNDELNGIINSGHTRRTASVIRSEKMGDGFEPRKFSTWCAQVIAGIGSQRGTLHDRSIHVELTRALPGQKPTKLPGNYFESMTAMRRKGIKWASDNLDRLQRVAVEVPACGNDRAEDNWYPLFALADLIGGAWPDRVLASYLTFTESASDGEESASHMLITDISEILDNWPYQAIPSKTLVESLIELEDRPWCEWRRGKPLTQNSLARLLKPYGVTSNTVRVGNSTPKGFVVEKLKVAFAPYISIPEVSTATPPQPATDQEKNVAVRKNVAVQSATNTQSATQKANKHKACGTVAVETHQIEPLIQNTDEVIEL